MAEGCVRGKGCPVSTSRLQLLPVSGSRTRPLLAPRLSPSGPLSSEASASLSQQRPQRHIPLTCSEQRAPLSPCLPFCAVSEEPAVFGRRTVATEDQQGRQGTWPGMCRRPGPCGANEVGGGREPSEQAGAAGCGLWQPHPLPRCGCAAWEGAGSDAGGRWTGLGVAGAAALLPEAVACSSRQRVRSWCLPVPGAGDEGPAGAPPRGCHLHSFQAVFSEEGC